MTDSNDPSLLIQAVRLGIPGLPNLTDSLIAGGLYVLIAETTSARFPILAASLASSLGDGIECRVILPQHPETFIQRIESFGNLNIAHAIQADLLRIFVMQDEFPKKMFRYGAEAFVQELDHFQIPEKSYLLFDQADDLLSLHDIVQALEQVEILRQWALAHQVTVFLIFSRTLESHTNTINALMDNLNGIARLGASRNGLELSFEYWQSLDGAIAARNFLLTTHTSGLYEASSVASSPEGSLDEDRIEQAEIEDNSEPQFFFMDPDLDSLAKQMQGQWQRVDTLVGMMHATRNIRSATCILSFQRDTNLRQLAETVHTLRLTMGRYARIVVQEKEASLRYQNEALLLKLGLNLVVNRDVSSSRVPLLLESLKGQVFNRDVDINFEAALASVLPTRLQGYLLPQRFAREVALIIERAETLNIPCALIIGTPSEGMTLSDFVSHSGISRPGDLVTTDTDSCHIFLNACPQSVLLITLERILGMPVDTAFADIRFIVQREEIQAELAALLHAADHESLPNYTAIVTACSAVDQIAEDSFTSDSQTGKKLQELPALSAVSSTKVNTPLKLRMGSRPSELKRTPSITETFTPPTEVFDSQSDTAIFNYDETSNVRIFSKNEAPRAIRAIQSSQ